MVKFVWLEIPDGGRVPVNPDQVQYVRKTVEGRTALIFGAVMGGLHQLVVAEDGEEVVRQLEGPCDACGGLSVLEGDAVLVQRPPRASRRRAAKAAS